MNTNKQKKEKVNPLFTYQEQANYEEGQNALQESMKSQTTNTNKPMKWEKEFDDYCMDGVFGSGINVYEIKQFIQQAIEEERERNYKCKVCGVPVNDVCYEHFNKPLLKSNTKK